MSSVRLDAARLVADGDALYGIANALSQAVRACESALGSTGGMAGDDESAEVFAQGQDGEPGYDKYAVDVLKGAFGVANSLKVVDAALGNSGRAYDGAQLVGAFKSAASSRIPEATATVSEPHASVPTALGKGPEGPLGEFGDFLKDALATLGVVLPSADTGKLGAAESAWSELSSSVTRVRGQVDSAFGNVQAMSLPQQQSMLSCQRSLSTALGKVSQSATSMSGFARGMIDSVNQAWEEIGWFIAQMAVEIAIEIGLGALLGMVTFGAGAAAMAAKIALTVTRWALKIAALCKKLRMLVMAALRAARLAIRGGAMVIRETLSAGLASAITTVSFNTVRGALDPNFQPQNVLNAALSAAAGGAAGGGVSRIGAGRLTDNVMNNGLRRATHIGVETTGGAIDGLVSGAAESGLNGTAFSPLSSMAAGALLGGALSGRPGGTSSAPSSPTGSGPGAGVSTPDAGSIPSGGTGAGSSTQNGGGTTVDVSNDAPTPGAGDSGSNTAGDGGSVDIPSDAPTPGSGDAGSPGGGDGGGLPDLHATDASGGSSDGGSSGSDAPSGDGSTPDVPSVDAPSVDAPSVDAPSGDGSTPDMPTADGSSPDAPAGDGSHLDAPSADGSSPDAPAGDGWTPEAPATDAPSVDGSTATPDAPSPDVPSATPDAPVTDAPGAPEASAPPADAPGAPAEVSSPDAPDAPSSDAPSTTSEPAGSEADTATADEASVDGPAPEDVAAVGGTAAAAAGGAALLTKPSLFTPKPASPATPPAPPSAPTSTGSPDASGPGSPSEPGVHQPGDPAAPDASGPDADAPEASTPDAPDGSQPDADDSGDTDTDAETADGNHSDRTIDEIDQALSAINPNFDPYDLSNGYATNCGHTSANLNDFLNGHPLAEAPGGSTLSLAEMQARTGTPQVPMTTDQIADTLRALGPGSHCVVGIDRTHGAGHWFNAYFDGTDVWSLDAQNHTRSPWPPFEPTASLWDASIPAQHVVPVAAPDAAATGGTTATDAPATPGATTTSPAAPDTATTSPAAPDGTNSSDGPAEKAGPSEPTDPTASDASRDAAHPWNEEMGEPVFSDADHGPGWQRVDDRVDTHPIDPHYGEVRPDGQSGHLADAYAHPGTVPAEIAHLISDPGAPYGRGPDGEPYSRTEWEARYTNAEGRPIYPGNDGGTPGSFVEFHDLDEFMRHYGDQLDRMGGPWGAFLSFPGTPFEFRSLPPSNLRDPYFTYGLGRLPDGVRIEVSEIAPAFGHSGGGLQVRVLGPDGPLSVNDLRKAGVLHGPLAGDTSGPTGSDRTGTAPRADVDGTSTIGPDAAATNASEASVTEGDAMDTTAPVDIAAPVDTTAPEAAAHSDEHATSATDAATVDITVGDPSLTWGGDAGYVDIVGVLDTPVPQPPIGAMDPSTVVFDIPADAHVFWSGRTELTVNGATGQYGSAGIAAGLAEPRNATTLEMYLRDHQIAMPAWDGTAEVAEIWGQVSQKYAEAAHGDVRVVLGRDLRPGNVWETYEFDALTSNPAVTRIIAIDPDSGAMRLLFERQA